MNEASNYVDLLKLRCNEMPQATAFIFLDDDGKEVDKWTYSDLDRQAQYVASLLKQGEGHVLLIYPPGPWFVAALFGCFYAQRVAVPTFPPTSKRVIPRLQHIVDDANVTTVLTTKSMAEDFSKFSDLLPQLGQLDWIDTDVERFDLESNVGLQKAVNNSERKRQTSRITNENDLAFLQYTSGSTRDPLGTMITHKNLMVNSAVIAKQFQHNRTSVGVIWLPPYHDMGLIGGILQPVYSGFPCVLMPPMTIMMRPILWLKAISHYRATTSGGPNFAFDLCLNRISIEDCEGLDLSCWKVAFNGAEPINADTLEKFAKKFADLGFRKQSFMPSYGLAEATLCASCHDADVEPTIIRIEKDSLENGKIVIANNGIRLVGCGQPPEGHQCHIVDPTSGKKKMPGEVGEIWLSGPSVAAGYWDRSELTQKTFHASLINHKEKFLRTGDLGSMLNGTLFVIGRMKDMMIIRGRNYHPHDVEASIADSLQKAETNSTAVFTVILDGSERLVIVQEVRTPKSDIESLDKIISTIRRTIFANEQLQVEAVVLVKRRAIPKTLSGKIQRTLCRKMYSNNNLTPLRIWRKDSTQYGYRGPGSRIPTPMTLTPKTLLG